MDTTAKHNTGRNELPADRVLATLNEDGSRHWINPRCSPGRFLAARRWTAYALIAIFGVLPWIQINGKPAILLDIAARRFTFFGVTFFPTDTLPLALLILAIFLTVFLVTAIAGRVWCGWACPQTVYMEFLYRPIERLIDGAPGSRRSQTRSGPRTVLKYILFLLCSCYLAHTFLAYFVGVDQLWHWIGSSPAAHPTAFIVMAATTALMMFDFAFFREQTCLVACPYGRLQSVMLDKHSMIVTYDRARGEPRGKKQLQHSDVALRVLPGAAADAPARSTSGDCIDCRMCVTTCPTGIDIRDGLQMECIGCAQCIDACDTVMDKLHRPRGLVRYSSRAVMEGQAKHLIRPRTVLYPIIIAGLVAALAFVISSRSTGEAAVLPRQGAPFYTLPTGEVANQVRLRLVNRTDEPSTFTITLSDDAASSGQRLIADTTSIDIPAGQTINHGLILAAPASLFSSRGRFDTTVTITDSRGFSTSLPFRMLGPAHREPTKEQTP
jgi:cytochrome c oxidase accessory protein FixG